MQHKVLEIGCGVGNSALPLLDIIPNLFFYSFDFSKKALQLLIEKSRAEKVEEKVSVFHWDPVVDESPSEFPHLDHSSRLPAEGIPSSHFGSMITRLTPCEQGNVTWV